MFAVVYGAATVREPVAQAFFRSLLEGLCISGFVVGQGAINAVVDAPGVKIGFQLRVDRLWMALVKPYV